MPEEERQNESKIIIDSDWKQEAASEKQRLDAEARQSGEKKDIPEPSFIEIVNMIVMQAAIGLGGFQAPTGESVPPDPQVARHYIDLLEVLQKKTEGNLNQEENSVLSTVLHEIRMRYVESVSHGGASAPQKPDDA